MRTTLVIMAAGIGSRFGGGIKQLAPVGLNGEIIMDYSIHDAIEAGFNKIVFIIRKDIKDAFKEAIGDRIEKICNNLDVEIAYAYQELSERPEGVELPTGRTKPWGTGHAVLACKEVLHEPFAVINADDYYGKEAFVRKKNFNYSLFGRMMTICFLAGYLRYLLLREQKNIKLFSWLSDRDAITNWNDEIYQTFYHIISHCIIASEQGEEYHRIQEVYLENIKEEIFYDEMNRVADYICGTFADFDYTDGSVTGDKQCKMMEDAISSNNYIIGISVEEKGVAQICHSKILRE